MVIKTGKKKKKIWYEVIASREFNNSLIGEIPSFEPKNLVGKCIKVSLMSLTGNPKKQNANIKFKISNVTERKASTEVVSYELSSSYIKRMVRKGKSKLDDSFILESKDKIKFRVKPVVVTRKKVQKSVLTALRKDLKEFLGQKAKEKDFSNFLNEILFGRFQMETKKKLSKVYPVALFDLRVVKRL